MSTNVQVSLGFNSLCQTDTHYSNLKKNVQRYKFGKDFGNRYLAGEFCMCKPSFRSNRKCDSGMYLIQFGTNIKLNSKNRM